MHGRPPYALLSPPPSDLRPTLQPRERPSLSQYRRGFLEQCSCHRLNRWVRCGHAHDS